MKARNHILPQCCPRIEGSKGPITSVPGGQFNLANEIFVSKCNSISNRMHLLAIEFFVAISCKKTKKSFKKKSQPFLVAIPLQSGCHLVIENLL